MAGQAEKTALVLQGGGALGAYQAGAYEALSNNGVETDWVAGISIGAINAALIAGNPPAERVDRLREFWDGISSWFPGQPLFPGDAFRRYFNRLSAWTVTAAGVPGFFAPRLPPAFAMPPGSDEATSVYDTAPLKDTLESLIDFDLLNDSGVRLSVGAVNVETGNFKYFDTTNQTIGPEHIMASGALPPGFPAVEIDGQPYWNGGLVSNTPLQYVLERNDPGQDLCIFQVDLFSAKGTRPGSLPDVIQREKEIRYSSRTRLTTDRFRDQQHLKRLAERLYRKLPDDLKNDPDAKALQDLGCTNAVTLVHLINRRDSHHLHSMDYEFSRLTLREHWEDGGNDVSRTFNHPQWHDRTRPDDGIAILDLTRD